MQDFLAFLSEINFVTLLQNSFYSLSRVFIGVLVAVALGIFFGLIRSVLPVSLRRNLLINFLFEAPKFPPPIAWIPFVIFFVGIGEQAAWLIVFIGAFSPIFIATYDAALSVPYVFQDTAKSLELKRVQYIFSVVLPASLPRIFVGIKTGVSMGWMSVIAAEMISGQSGLGYSIQLNRLNLQFKSMMLDMIFIALIGFMLFELIRKLEKFFLPWAEKSVG